MLSIIIFAISIAIVGFTVYLIYTNKTKTGDTMATSEQLFRDRDFTLIVDNSGSMKDLSHFHCKNMTKWQEAYHNTFDVARMSQYDSGVLSLYLFSDTFKRWNAIRPEAIEKIWLENPPGVGGTNLTAVLKDAFDNYFKQKAAGTTKLHGEFIVVITDGVPNDEQKVIDTLVEATKLMTTDEELAVFFLQTGVNEKAAAFLKGLDEKLVAAGAKFDIVDTKTFSEIEGKPLLGVLINALND